MLITKFFVNKNEIGEIHVQRVAGEPGDEGFCEYRIRKPKGYASIPIMHKYESGALKLMELVLRILNNRDYNFPQVSPWSDTMIKVLSGEYFEENKGE